MMMASQTDRLGGLLNLELSKMTSGNFISNQSDNLPFQHRLITSLLTRFLTEQNRIKVRPVMLLYTNVNLIQQRLA